MADLANAEPRQPSIELPSSGAANLGNDRCRFVTKPSFGVHFCGVWLNIWFVHK